RSSRAGETKVPTAPGRWALPAALGARACWRDGRHLAPPSPDVREDRVLAADIMTTAVDTIDPDAPADDALRILGTHAITALPVVDDRGRLVGIVSEGDLLAGGVARDPRSTLRRD